MPFEVVPEVFRDGVLYVDNSMLMMWGSCQRKEHLRYNLGMTTRKDPNAPMFGTAGHAALAAYYEGASVPDCIEAFVAIAKSDVSTLPIRTDEPDGNRSVERGLQVLNEYFKRYGRPEPWEIVATEVGFAVSLSVDPPIIYRGRIDLLVKEHGSTDLTVIDHKFTSALGPKFMDKLRPNDAITGYCWSVEQTLERPTHRAMLNVIGVLKSEIRFARGVTHRNEADFTEWRDRTLRKARALYYQIERTQKLKEESEFRMFEKNTDQCGSYGGCLFQPICKLPDASSYDEAREALLRADFAIRPWKPY